MNINSRIICMLAILILVISISVPDVAAIVEKKEFKVLVKEANSIKVGKVTDKKSYWEGSKIFTDITISVDMNLKGNNDNQVSVKLPGGVVGNIHAEVSDVPYFEKGEDVILFSKGDEVVGWDQGKYTIKNRKITGTNESEAEFVKKIRNEVTNSSKNNGTVEQPVGEYAAPLAIPHITDVTPDSGPAKAAELGSSTPAPDSTQVTITGTNFGATAGSARFWGYDTTVYNAAIESWTDTQIVARVPGGISSWAKPGGYGNVQVVDSAFNPSDNYGNFRVTYSYGGGRWPGTGFTYKVNPNTADGLAAVQAAANTWNNAGANFTFTYGGPTTTSSVGYDSENVVIWSSAVGSGILAACWTWWDDANPQVIIENDIEFNDDYMWSTSGAGGTFDIQTIATHELGHGLQLLDMYGTQDIPKVMYGFGSSGTTKRDLNEDDVDGIKAIYGAATPGRKLMTFARGADNALWFRKYDGTAWGVWQTLGGMITSDPDAVSSAPNKVDVVVRGADNALWIRRYDGAVWGAWQSLDGNFNSGPGIASSNTNLLEVFARGSDNALWVKRYDGDTWGSWQSLGGILSSDPDASNKLDIVVRGADNGLWIKRYSGGAWSAWQSLGGMINSGPTAASSGASNLDVFARGADNALWQKTWNGASWGAWQSLGGIISSDPDATSPGSGIDIVTRGADNALWQKTWNGASWGAWQSLGGIINSGPTIASWT